MLVGVLSCTLWLVAALPVGAPPPTIVVVAPRPTLAIPKAEGLLGSLSRVEPSVSPHLMRQKLAHVGIPDLSPEAFRSVGLAPDRAAYAWLRTFDHVPVFELSVDDPAKTVAWMTRTSTLARAQLMRDSGKSMTMVFGALEDPHSVVFTDAKRSLLQLDGGPGSPRPEKAGASDSTERILSLRYPLIESAKRGRKPSKPPSFAGSIFTRSKAKNEGPDFYAFASDVENFERGEAAVWIEPGKVILRARAKLDLQGSLQIAELAAQKQSEPLVMIESESGAGAEAEAEAEAKSETPAAAELVARFDRTVEMCRVLRVDTKLCKLVSGRIHAIFTVDGSIVIALELVSRPPDAVLPLFSAAIASRFGEAEVTVLDRRKHSTRPLLIVLWGAASVPGRGGEPKVPTVKAWDISHAGEAHDPRSQTPAPIEFRLRPDRILRAIEGRSRAQQGPRPPRALAATLGLIYGDFLRAFSSIHAKFAVRRGGVETEVEVLHPMQAQRLQ